MQNKTIIICGPTGVGKTRIALKLAKKINGEIISADSRQVYIGMDIGTGKDVPKNSNFIKCCLFNTSIDNSSLGFDKNIQTGYFLVKGVPVWGLNFAKPDYIFNVGDYYKIATVIIAKIFQSKKVPIIVGGTGLYINSLVQDLSLIGIAPDWNLRKRLEKLSLSDLQKMLLKLSREKFNSMNNSDKNNPRRVVRAIEIANHQKNNSFKTAKLDLTPKYKFLLLGLTTDKDTLLSKIKKRIDERIKNGMLDEINTLLEEGYNWDLPSLSGLGYSQMRPYLENKISFREAVINWRREEFNYAKRQMVWFKKNKHIIWFDTKNKDFYTNIEKTICQFLRKTI